MFKKILKDIVLTMYDHPTEFKCMSLARVGAWYFGTIITITWYKEVFDGVKFSSWGQLTTCFVTCLTAYGLKKWKDPTGAVTYNMPYLTTSGEGDDKK